LTELSFLAAEVLSILALALAGYFLIVYVGSDIVPLRMRLIYRQTRRWLAEAGWGKYPDTGESGKTYDMEYSTNRREDS